MCLERYLFGQQVTGSGVQALSLSSMIILILSLNSRVITQFLIIIKLTLSIVTNTLLITMSTIVIISIHRYSPISQLFLAAFDGFVDYNEESTHIDCQSSYDQDGFLLIQTDLLHLDSLLLLVCLSQYWVCGTIMCVLNCWELWWCPQ